LDRDGIADSVLVACGEVGRPSARASALSAPGTATVLDGQQHQRDQREHVVRGIVMLDDP
jgi:hypothetical protein